VVLQWCYIDVTVVLQWCYSGVAVPAETRETSVALAEDTRSRRTHAMIVKPVPRSTFSWLRADGLSPFRTR
jgi:hypothetical protein